MGVCWQGLRLAIPGFGAKVASACLMTNARLTVAVRASGEKGLHLSLKHFDDLGLLHLHELASIAEEISRYCPALPS